MKSSEVNDLFKICVVLNLHTSTTHTSMLVFINAYILYLLNVLRGDVVFLALKSLKIQKIHTNYNNCDKQTFKTSIKFINRGKF